MALDLASIDDSSVDWELFQQTPDMRRYRLEYEPGKFIVRTEYLSEKALLAQNKQLYDESHGQKFGNGKIVARIPLNVFYKDFAPRLKDGDDDFAKWFLNHDNNRAYRTFRGRV